MSLERYHREGKQEFWKSWEVSRTPEESWWSEKGRAFQAENRHEEEGAGVDDITAESERPVRTAEAVRKETCLGAPVRAVIMSHRVCGRSGMAKAKAKGLGDHLGACARASGESNWDESTRGLRNWIAHEMAKGWYEGRLRKVSPLAVEKTCRE